MGASVTIFREYFVQSRSVSILCQSHPSQCNLGCCDHAGRCVRRSTKAFLFCFDLSNMAQWLKFQLESCVLAEQNLSVGGANVATVCSSRIPNFSKNIWPRPRSMWRPSFFFFEKTLYNKSGATPSTTCTRSTPSTLCSANRVYGHSSGLQCRIVTKTEGHGLLDFNFLCVPTPPFPLASVPILQSFLLNQEARAEGVHHSLLHATLSTVVSSKVDKE